MEELRQIKWCIEALCIYGHGFAWMYAFRNTGAFESVPSLFFGSVEELDLPFHIAKDARICLTTITF